MNKRSAASMMSSVPEKRKVASAIAYIIFLVKSKAVALTGTMKMERDFFIYRFTLE